MGEPWVRPRMGRDGTKTYPAQPPSARIRFVMTSLDLAKAIFVSSQKSSGWDLVKHTGGCVSGQDMVDG
jgi:hypothetical protein